MAYKVKHKHQRISKDYWEKRELETFRQKKKKSFGDFAREGTRKTFNIFKTVHKKGQLIEYKERIGKVKKVSRKGIYVELLSKPTDKSLAGKPEMVFISQKEIEKGKVYPAYLTSMPPFFAYRKLRL